MCARLERDGWDVTRVDVKQGVDCRDVFRHDTARYELVVHLAAVVGGRMTIDREPMRVATDLAIDSDFFQYVLRTRPKRSVYYSSSAAYPVRLQQHLDHKRLREDDISLDVVDEPDAIYGWVKLTGERLARHANELDAGVYVFRPFSGYGWDQDLDYPFPSILSRARHRQNPIQVWGSGEQVRDWVHIEDVVEATVQALDWDPTAIGPVNIGTGVGTSFVSLAKMMANACGYETEVKAVGGPEGVMHRVCDPDHLQKIYTPAITIEEGIDRGIRHHMSS